MKNVNWRIVKIVFSVNARLSGERKFMQLHPTSYDMIDF
jgi:hypothetical protein